MGRNDGPSPDDIQRFSGETGFCPECGAEIWDQADVCPECHTYLSGGARIRPPVEEWFRSRWLVLVAILILAIFIFITLWASARPSRPI